MKSIKKNYTLKIRNKVITIDYPLIMAILNLSPDSFYDGKKDMSLHAILERCALMVEEGAHILDIGACSSRPGAEFIDQKEEINRLLPVLKKVRKSYPDIIISVDTFRSAVADMVVSEGADMINDISAGNLDPDMFDRIASLNVPYVMMHMQGTPESMQANPQYHDLIEEIYTFFLGKIKQLHEKGLSDIIIDPGFGFGKSLEHNYQLLRHLSYFQFLGKPLLAGLSRKSMIYKALDIDPDAALNATTVLNTLALINGADILRVHDVKEAAEIIKLLTLYRKSELIIN